MEKKSKFQRWKPFVSVSVCERERESNLKRVAIKSKKIFFAPSLYYSSPLMTMAYGVWWFGFYRVEMCCCCPSWVFGGLARAFSFCKDLGRCTWFIH